MSYSNIQSQNQQADISNRNHSPPFPIAHSQTSPPINPQHKEWVATYLDGQYYLTAPDSIQKLHIIQAELENQRKRLAKMKEQTLSHNNSYLSFQQQLGDRQSEISCCTQFDQNRHFNRQMQVKEELEREEEEYRKNIKIAEREKLQLIKNMKLNQKKIQQKLSPSRKQPSHRHLVEPIIDGIVTLPIQKSAKESRKSSHNQHKEKSYHKNRIQKSIIESGQAVEGEKSPEKSMKPSDKQQEQPVARSAIQKSKQETQKSINIVILQPNHTIMPKQMIDPPAEPSAKGSISPNKSVKASSRVGKEPSVKAETDNAAQNRPSEYVRERQEVIRPTPSEILSKNNSEEVNKSVKQSQKDVQVEQSKHSSKKSQKLNKSNEPLKQKDGGEPNKSEKNSIKRSAKEPSEHPSRFSKKQTRIEIQQQAVKSMGAPSMRASSKHSKAKELQKSIKLSEQLNNNVTSAKQNSQMMEGSKISSHKQVIPFAEIGQLSNKSSPSCQSQPPKEQDARSENYSRVIEETPKSYTNNAQEELEVKSYRKSSKKVEKDAVEVSSKKSQQLIAKEEAFSQKASSRNKNQSAVSHKSSVISSKKSQSKEQEPISPSLKQKNSAMESKSIVSEHQSFSKKSSAVVAIEAKPVPSQKMNESIQYSRVTSQNHTNSASINQTNSQIQAPSVKESSFLVHEDSIKQSSRVVVDVKNQLKPEAQQAAPEYDIRKRKMEDNQSQKKQRSFVIHSRNSSVKDKQSNSEISSPSRKSKDPSSIGQSVTKGEILKLHEQIAQLQDKLKRVEERQQQIERIEGTLSKIHFQPQHFERQEVKIERKQNENAQEVEKGEEVKVEWKESNQEKQNKLGDVGMPVIELPEVQIRAQPRLRIESSILQVNTLEEVRKKQQKDNENGEKAKLKEEINRLKRIIRDMQIQKIRSIDLEGQDNSSTPQGSRIERELLSSVEAATPTRRFGSTNKRLLEDAGKIVHNNSGLPIEVPRRKSISKLRLPEEDVPQVAELLPESTKRSKGGKLYVEARRGQLAARISQKQRDFHSFIESSRVIAEDNSRNEGQNNNIKNFSKVTVAQDVEYSRLVQQIRKPNPQEEEILPQVHLRDIQFPALPDVPQANMTQEELLTLARTTYLAFGVDVEAEGKQLCVKKYKNCVIFTLDGQHHQCVLWHFSGKFYMGSWRAGQPGEGEKEGQGLEFIPGKHLYKGQFLAGKRHGSGILKQVNGNIYDGQWADGVKSGRGVYLDAATRVIYSGEWREGRKEGQGFLKLSQKEYYYGTFVRSIKEGFGVQVFVNGDKYRGEYKAGKFHGRGKYLWANGSCYEGQFYEGVRHGQGSWRSAITNPDIYIGSYENDKKTGYGRYVWANGCMYQGGFANDLKHGKGRLTYQDGKEIKGIWEEGNLITTEPQKHPSDHEDLPLRRSVKVASFLPVSAKRI